MAIIDISKTFMYDFHYNFMVKTFGEKCQLLYSDTGSFCYEIKFDDFYEIVKKNISNSN